MAASNNITVGVNASVNGLNINQSSAVSTVPTGSIAIAESILVNTGSWQQITTGSSQTIGSISVFNTGLTGSLQVAVSGSGFVSNIGTLQPGQASSVWWNQTLNGLWSQAYTTSSFGIFVIIAA